MNGTSQDNAVNKKPNIFSAMGSFFKKNSDTITKMLVHQLGLTVFGFLLHAAALASESKSIMIALGLFSAIFYLFLLYVVAWELGSKDKIKIDGGRMKRDVFKGAKLNLAANIPNLLVATVSLIAYLFIDFDNLNAAGELITPAWAVNTHFISASIGKFLNCMYMGIGMYFNVYDMPWFLFAVCAPSIIVCGVGYFFGTIEKYGIFASPAGSNNK